MLEETTHNKMAWKWFWYMGTRMPYLLLRPLRLWQRARYHAFIEWRNQGI